MRQDLIGLVCLQTRRRDHDGVIRVRVISVRPTAFRTRRADRRGGEARNRGRTPNPTWPAKFAKEREKILTALGVKAVRVDKHGLHLRTWTCRQTHHILDIGLGAAFVNLFEVQWE